MPTYKIGLMSDLHDSGGNQHQNFISINSIMTDAGVNARIWLGDMVDSWVTDDIEGLCALRVSPTYWIMGGHDGGTIGDQTYPENFVDIITSYQPSMTACGDLYVDFGNWRMILLNNGNNLLSAESFSWLDATLGNSGNKFVIIFTHEGLAPNPGDEGSFIIASDATAVRALITSHVALGRKVRACLYGHGHASGWLYPQSNYIDGVIHFQITASQNLNNTCAILNLYENGDFYIDGRGYQKSLNNFSDHGLTHTINTAIGSNDHPYPHPRKNIQGFFEDFGLTISESDSLVFEGPVVWHDNTWTNFLGSIHHHVVSGGFNTILKAGGKTISGTTERLPQGDVFKISSVVAD